MLSIKTWRVHFTLLQLLYPFACSAMDDVYQYTAEAVKANKNSNTHNVQTDQEEEEDPLVNAFNNFGFGRRWSNLVDSVKKQVQCVHTLSCNISSKYLLFIIE